MKGKLVIVAALAMALLFWNAPAWADKEVLVWSGQGTSESAYVDTRTFSVAQVTIWAASGVPDGTVTIYKSDSDAPEVVLGTYATPTVAKCLAGPVGTRIRIALTGQSAGTVGVKVVLK